MGNAGEIVYTTEIGSASYLDPWDWIAVFKEDFRSLEDYVTFTWASACRLTGVEKKAFVMESAIVEPGIYRLVYFGAKNCVLGISSPFDVAYPDDFLGPIPVDRAVDALDLAGD